MCHAARHGSVDGVELILKHMDDTLNSCSIISETIRCCFDTISLPTVSCDLYKGVVACMRLLMNAVPSDKPNNTKRQRDN